MGSLWYILVAASGERPKGGQLNEGSYIRWSEIVQLSTGQSSLICGWDDALCKPIKGAQQCNRALVVAKGTKRLIRLHSLKLK